MTDTLNVTGEFAPAETISIAAENAVATEGVHAPEVAHAEAEAPQADVPKVDVPNGFVELGLAPELVQAVGDLGYTQPTTVQLKTIPLALPNDNADAKAGFIDLMVSSQTGSGKTAAFLLPVLHTLIQQQAQAEAADKAAWDKLVADAAANGEEAPKRAKRKDPTNTRNFKAPTPGALIVCPTRELAQQVAHDAIDLVKHCRGLRVANVVGGMPYQLQIAKLQNADLVVATPGRLLDLQRSMQIKLDKVQFLVVDEADRMLDLGFSDDLAEINQLTIDRKQTMMFSATFAPRIQQLATRVMRQPQRVQIDSPQEKHNNIRQVLHWADNAQHKRRLLDHLLRDTTINQAIIFASTQIECDGLANDLQQEGFSAVALHGALSQGLRNRRLMALRQGQVQFLVATDVAARGIDVPTITHVFNFGLPMKSEDYTHRIGRTGRAGRDGLAITLAEFRDKRKIYDIEAYTRQQFTAEVIPGMEPTQRVEQRGGAGRDYDRKGGGKFGGGGNRGGFGGNKFGGGGGRFEGNGQGRFEPRSEGRSEGRFEGRQDNHRSDAPRGNSFEPRQGAPRGNFGDNRGFNENRGFGGEGRGAPRGNFGEGQGAPRGNFGAPRSFEDRAPRSFDDRAPARGPRAPFEAGRTPFDKPARPAGGKSFGGFDAKKRAPKPRTPR
ncbi:DEAD/DEAH box helicase [Limnohabitans sp. TEGF004]|uniref:DEAD/DEAH box helicase n=1 Tax=Limnohabitans sp. TEGF004 TaxID=2986281 RepID=UPI0023775C18|nr:DEAD/DEAH box helicase [Limnohabitans sp. TEGF004]BDU56134.1 DEAD/DEAH box helicase [Limnohabitans sp. TEGF004]